MSTLNKNKPLSRLAFLDALRAFAALAVLVQHTFEVVSIPFVNFTKYYFQFGVFGVTLFFLCSGFIIPVSLEKAKSLKTFWIRRFFRLYPLYIFATITLIIIEKYIYHYQIDLIKIICATFMIAEPARVRVLGLSWTLTLELIFYIIISILYVTKLYKYSVKNAMFILLIAILNAIFIGKYFGIFFYFATFFMGNIFYKYYKELITSKQFYLIFAIYLCSIVAITGGALYGKDALAVSGTHRFVPATLSFLSSYIFFFIAMKYRYLAIFKNRFILFLGLISYSLYLMQTFALLLMQTFTLLLPIYLYALMVVIATIVLAIITYYLIEKPFIVLGRRLS